NSDNELNGKMTEERTELQPATIAGDLPPIPNPPLVGMGALANRYVSFFPNNPGRPVAFCIRIPPCRVVYVDRPRPQVNADGTQTQWVAGLVDNPVFRVWNEPGIRVGGCPIAPGLTYEVGALDLFNQKSETVMLGTVQMWGDVTGPGQGGTIFGPPDGIVNELDLEAVVLAQAGSPLAPPTFRVDLAPATPDYVIDQQDISAIQSALMGLAYPPQEFGIEDISQCDLEVVCNRECADSNCDGVVSVSDIGYFVVAITEGQQGWQTRFIDATPSCNYTCVNDLNGDGNVTVSDIGPFVQRLTGQGRCD
ncbi:MAG: hypothetical protein AB7N71_07155, partial [Phycisphaerae bacterium]